MTIYQVGVLTPDGQQGYKYFSNQAEAKRQAAEWIKEHDVEPGDITVRTYQYPLTKTGMLDALNHLASHPDNG